MKNVKKHGDIKLVTTGRTDYLVSDQIIILQSFSQKIY